MSEPITITVTDVRDAGLCIAGARRWAEGQGIDFRQFVKDGISSDRLVATGEAFALRVVHKAMSERGQ